MRPSLHGCSSRKGKRVEMLLKESESRRSGAVRSVLVLSPSHFLLLWKKPASYNAVYGWVKRELSGVDVEWSVDVGVDPPCRQVAGTGQWTRQQTDQALEKLSLDWLRQHRAS